VLLFPRVGHFDHGVATGRGRKLFEDRADRRQRRVVARQQVPVGIADRSSSRSSDSKNVSRLCARRPPGGGALIAVQNEVHVELSGGGIETAHAVGPHRRPLVGRRPDGAAVRSRHRPLRLG
jgi:hypothetical protein